MDLASLKKQEHILLLYLWQANYTHKCSNLLQHANESNPKYELNGILEFLVFIYFNTDSNLSPFQSKVSASMDIESSFE